MFIWRSNRAQSGQCLIALALVVSVGLTGLGGWALGQDLTANEGTDLAIGGPGSGPGQFLELRAIAFDTVGELYALDGVHQDPKTRQFDGNLRIQKFSRAGKLLASIDLRAAFDAIGHWRLEIASGPQRLAVASSGDVYVTFPDTGRVCRFGPDGRLAGVYEVPHALAIAVWHGAGGAGPERIAVVGSHREALPGQGWIWMGDRIALLDPAAPAPANSKSLDGVAGFGTSKEIATIPLGRPLPDVQDLATDRAGSFYVKAEPNVIGQFAPDGRFLKAFGGNPTRRTEDGSELLYTVAVDSKGNVYSFTWGNPGHVTRFEAASQEVAQRDGQFKWADPWTGTLAFAIDAEDGLWVAVTGHHPPAEVRSKGQRAIPMILRTRADYFDAPPGSVHRVPIQAVGFRPALTCRLPYNVSYEPGRPVPMQYMVSAANRSIHAATVTWRAFDAQKSELASGRFDLALQDGAPVVSDFSFTPPAFGAYLVIAAADSPAGPLEAVGAHVGVAPQYSGMQTLGEGQDKGGWIDPPRQLWTGLPEVRIHPGKDEQALRTTDAEVAVAEQAGVTFVVQLVDNMKSLTPEYVRLVATRYKGRVRYYEVCNEPNFSCGPDEYFRGHEMAYQIIKQLDPQAHVMGPATVNMNLPWLERLYDLGFKNISDAISIHDYEGHESITPEHWRWKMSQVRRIMAAHGDAAKPVWQTERAIAGVRGRDFQGLVQAIRCTLHVDLLETLGIAPNHNFHYYLNQGGYAQVPSYLWSANGPHPGALALRTRQGLTAALGRTYRSMLDFGPAGNSLLLGLRYAGPNGGQTIVIRNLGSRAIPVDFIANGDGPFEVSDAWGNRRSLTAVGGRLRLAVEQLPAYILLAPSQALDAPALDLGINVAPQAKWQYTARVEKGEFGLLTNGVLETYHDADPDGDTDGRQIWTGELPIGASGKVIPQTLTAMFDSPRIIDRIVIHGVRADNTFCALLDYDLEYTPDGASWKPIEHVRRPMPASEAVRSADADHAIWMDDTNFFLHAFAPREARGIRLRVLNVTHGFVPDDRATAWGNTIPQKLMLREIEIYSPPADRP